MSAADAAQQLAGRRVTAMRAYARGAWLSRAKARRARRRERIEADARTLA
jgi:hypothetical protein